MDYYPHELVDRFRDDIIRIAAHHGATNVRVFGSVARRDDRRNSDVDLLVQFEPGRSIFDHVGLVQDLEACIGKSVDVVTESSLHWYIRDRVLAEAIEL